MQYVSPLNELLASLPAYAMQFYQTNVNKALRDEELQIERDRLSNQSTYQDKMFNESVRQRKIAEQTQEMIRNYNEERKKRADEIEKKRLGLLEKQFNYNTTQNRSLDTALSARDELFPDYTPSEFYDENTGLVNKGYFDQGLISAIDMRKQLSQRLSNLGVKNPNILANKVITPDYYKYYKNQIDKKLLQNIVNEYDEFKDIVPEDDFRNFLKYNLGEERLNKFFNLYPDLLKDTNYPLGYSPEGFYEKFKPIHRESYIDDAAENTINNFVPTAIKINNSIGDAGKSVLGYLYDALKYSIYDIDSRLWGEENPWGTLNELDEIRKLKY